MELEYLKEIWKDAGEDKAIAVAGKQQLLNLPGAPSQNLVSKMRRNLFYELLIVLVCVAVIAIFYFVSFGGQLKEVSWTYILLAIVFIIYFHKKNKLLKDMQCPACQVKHNLSLQLATLEKYVRLYLIAGTAMAPVVMLFFYVLLHYKHLVIFPSVYAGKEPSAFTLLYLLITGIFTMLFYLLNRWYISHLYGRHIQKLKTLLLEMEE
ncbi:hypothetical protein [Agriterribacter sp.]|uniref:hypothetical protein n=1 Tax=Agriterribacter sp. TaxID=2821509 RepID=UPI002C7ABCBF|nr:hypothetical protein [Agriterribacter sp.]HTN07814.1 hypothetical protein [Agriterribacter sp.]